MCSACAESAFRDKDSVPVQQRFFFLDDVADEDTATMYLSEIAEVRGDCCIDECCDDLLPTQNDDVWYRENIKNIVSSSSLMDL